MDWESAKTKCDNLVLNGFSDWRLPTKEELNILYQNKDAIGMDSFAVYWSSTVNSDSLAWLQYFANGDQASNDKVATIYVRAVRTF